MENHEIKIDINSLPVETQKYILALAAQNDITPEAAARLVLNHAAKVA